MLRHLKLDIYYELIISVYLFSAEIPQFDGIIPAESKFFSFCRNLSETELFPYYTCSIN